MTVPLRGKTIIITGASAGIGAATAEACAAAGMNVVLSARRADRLEEAAARVCRHGVGAVTIVGDICAGDHCAILLDEAERAFGGFHAVFANAGYGLEKPLVATGDDELRAIFETNFFAGAALLRTAAQRLLRSERRGHLLMNASCLAKIALPMLGAYSATKAAQWHFCSALRAELKRSGIDVSCVFPVGTRTEFFAVLERQSGSQELLPHKTPDLFMQRPERVADAIVRCLRRPRPEVWTSALARIGAGVMVMSPRIAAFVAEKQLRGLRHRDVEAADSASPRSAITR